MKKITHLSFVIFLSLTHLNAQTEFPTGIGGCIAHWDFTTPQGIDSFYTLPDVSMNGNNGIPNNIFSETGFRGFSKTAGKFDGFSSYAMVNDAPILKTDSITVVSLIKFEDFYTGLCQFNTIIYKGFDHNSNQNWSFFIGDHNYDNNCEDINIDKQLLNFRSSYSSTTDYPLYSTSNYISANKWYFLAAVYNRISTKIYIVEFDITTPPDFSSIEPITILSTGNINNSTTYDIYIGKTQNPPFPYWVNGIYDELILYNRPLTNIEIQKTAQYLFGGTTNTFKNDEIRDFNIYSHDKIIRIEDPQQILKNVELYDLLGKKLSVSDKREIDMSNIPSQIILVKCISKDGRIYHKKIALN